MVDRRRQRISLFLLAVYALMLAAGALHVHVNEGGESFYCADCAHHVKHPGHVVTATTCECQLCLFFASSYLPAQVAVWLSLAVVGTQMMRVPTQKLSAVRFANPTLRAPPSL